MFINYIYLFVCFVICTSSVDVQSVNKRSDIDLQTCIDNFDIHKDKIIRTQDSRNMGAKYLNEIDLGSREECLRLCCETDTCDVFVYEEKSPGGCYLFHCGPPEDFKCKFTRHANYSSAVLTVNRHLNELENQIKLTKHEQDLARLRKPDDGRPQHSKLDILQLSSTLSPTTSTEKTTVAKEILPIAEVTKPPPYIGSRHCSRYQFECRTSGECIAIYNACDGIPQCADGSDEAPELGCPEQLGTTSVPSPPPPQLSLLVHPIQNEYEPTIRKQLPQILPDTSYQQLPSNHQRIPTDYLRPASNQQPAALPVAYNDPAMQQPQQQAFIPAARPQPWNQAQLPVISNAQYGDKNSHIFNHKESGLQVVDTQDRYKYKGAMQTLHHALARGQYVDTTRGTGGGTGSQYGDTYPKIPNYYGDIYRPQYPVPDNWSPNRATGDVNPYLNNDNWQPIQPPQARPVNDETNQIYRQNVEVKQNWKTDLINTQAESKSYEHTIIHEPKVEEPKIIQPIVHEEIKKYNEHIERKHVESNIVHKKEHVHHDVMTAELKQNVADLLDGEAERPGSAILSLTLGVCLTCMMAILIGCRLRVVRRRMRRGGKSPYAHDADYLVNGMYL